jgi:stage IV sporulation protein B
MTIKNKNYRFFAIILLMLAAFGVLFYGVRKNTVISANGDAYQKSESQRVYIGGMPVGIMLQSKGVLVVGKLEIVTDGGGISPTDKSDVQIIIGDVILKINDVEINCTNDLINIINAAAPAAPAAPTTSTAPAAPLNVLVKRKEKEFVARVTPVKDIVTGQYKIGLWVRDTAVGVGTVTYIKESDLSFAALGHPICDPDTKEMLSISGGKIYDCSIVGLIKGQRGRPGELKGLFSKEESIGTVRLNNRFGIYGKLTRQPAGAYGEPVGVATRAEIKIGKAKIVTAVSGSAPAEYDIEIVKKNNQKTPSDRSMIIKITDKNLLKETGGIVQGMSGSPIMQNGRLVGGVTHVFINDPTQGYALYADWMLAQ